MCGRASSAQSARVAQQVEVVKPGLSKEAIARIPITSSFANPEGGTSSSSSSSSEACAICLGELDDRVRVLPKCSHAFHAECVDMWLFSHKTCPTCRSDLSSLEQQQQQQQQQQQPDQMVVVVVDSR
ncbi:hypothetical protein SELMODRAFT_137241 [Selaginella moellendorffii]|uniref:RING-type E3 ubiquitin transferase n=1 Tax=Selaginella moellendorffii TaxID=88036 RepID=D8TD85_SELML|nr:hypothetical protein SELMODRAFT_137241 [Selaginella moellendorffii]